ncbi:hypothetical protein PMKS-001796 [Pichia membranifaciens]|uniref:Uncharacterized protein n=1 Tax=Pichia membranifaciens TaxID=4926 RepID=A0A1Q2YFS4_9ASCO|nr:hypothetical protein PMKS-001796 [Pichia membranifaciens]
MTEGDSVLERNQPPEVVDVADSSDEEVYEADVPFANRLRQRRAKLYQNYEEDDEDEDEDDEGEDEEDTEEISKLNGDAETTRETFSPEIVGMLPERRITHDAVYTAQHGGDRPVVDDEYFEYGDSSMDEEEIIDGRKINPLHELDEAIDAIYERKINSQIKKYSQDHKVTKKGFPSKCTYQRRIPEDIHLSPLLKEGIINKLDSVIDKLTDYHINSIVKTQKISRRLGTNGKTPKRASTVTYGLDWLSVLSCLDNKDKHSKMLLLRLFNLKLDKDTINGPVNSYPIDNELYTATKLRRDRILKNLISKSKVNLKNSKTTQYAKNARKQKNNISYNLDSFLNLGLYYTKDKRLKERNVSVESDI